MRFRSADKKFEVYISEHLIYRMIQHLHESKVLETGGILLGIYIDEGTCANVLHITGPPLDSKRGSTWFIRGIKGLQSIINKSWKKNEYYLGEWHFHPHGLPDPSNVDIEQMAQIASSKTYSCPEPILLIVGGSMENFEIACYVVLKNKKTINLKANSI